MGSNHLGVVWRKCQVAPAYILILLRIQWKVLLGSPWTVLLRNMLLKRNQKDSLKDQVGWMRDPNFLQADKWFLGVLTRGSKPGWPPGFS